MVDFPAMAAIRLGYGLSPIHAPPATPQAVLDSVAWSAALPPGVTTAAARDAYREVGEMRKLAEKTDETADDQFRADLGDSMRAIELGRMTQAADAPVGFGERLVSSGPTISPSALAACATPPSRRRMSTRVSARISTAASRRCCDPPSRIRAW